MISALITGGTGFIGSNLAGRLVNEGWHVHVLTNPTSALDLLSDVAGRITFCEYDGTIERMQAIVSKTKPDIVFHLASLFIDKHHAGDIKNLIQSNILLGTQLLEAMTAAGIAKIVNAGTSWQHYENRPYSPVNLYAATKQAFEDIMLYYVEALSMRAITLKLFDTYGPKDPRPKLLSLLARVASDGASIAMSPGEQVIDLVHIDDVVEAFLRAGKRLMKNQVSGHEVYAVTSGRPVSLKVIVKIFEKALGRPLNMEWGGRPYRPREVMTPWTDFNILPGWKAKKRIEDSLANLANDFISRGRLDKDKI